DGTFGTGGKVTTSLGSNDLANALVLQPDGKLVAAGYTYNAFALVRYLGPVCGDGIVDAPEQCDAGAANGTATSCCTTTCKFKTSGMVCNDGNACTQTDSCNSTGTCVGSNPVVCSGANQCRTCDSATGTCSVNKTDGTACNDGNACTQTDTCQSG